jgi:hypothetical protein
VHFDAQLACAAAFLKPGSFISFSPWRSLTGAVHKVGKVYAPEYEGNLTGRLTGNERYAGAVRHLL